MEQGGCRARLTPKRQSRLSLRRTRTFDFGLRGPGGRLGAVIVELINTGSELMLGRVLNTHQQWLCRHLADLGYVVTRQVAVPDTGTDIQQAVREALARADLVIATGGLARLRMT